MNQQQKKTIENRYNMHKYIKLCETPNSIKKQRIFINTSDVVDTKNDIHLSEYVAKQLNVTIGDCIIINCGLKCVTLEITNIINDCESYIHLTTYCKLQLDFDGGVAVIIRINKSSSIDYKKYLGTVWFGSYT